MNPEWRLSLVTAPTAEPVTLTDAKNHLRVDFSADDALIGNLITAAREYVEKYARRALITQTWDLRLDRFPDDAWLTRQRRPVYDRAIVVPVPPLQSVTSISYVDGAGSTQTLASSAYQVITGTDTPGRISPAPGFLWPTTQDEREAAVTVRFVAGYGSSSAAVPAAARAAMLLMVGHLYENRGDGSKEEVPPAVRSLLDSVDWGSY